MHIRCSAVFYCFEKAADRHRTVLVSIYKFGTLPPGVCFVSIQKSLFITEYGYFLGKEKLDIKVGNAKSMLSIPAHGVRSLGSCAMDMMQIARGGADMYFEIGIHIWDVAAATIIIRESGGAVVGYKRPEGLDEKILIVDEPYDLNQRKVLCIRGTKEGKEMQSKLLEEVRKNLKEFEIESD